LTAMAMLVPACAEASGVAVLTPSAVRGGVVP